MLPSFEELKHPPFHHEMILVEGGAFMMGSEEEDSFEDEWPAHKVTLNSFLIGKYPVTQALWKQIMGDNPSFFIGDNLPVERVSWDDTQGFIEKLNQITNGKYRLPTEAEWEFAARGGRQSKGLQYAGADEIHEVGWYEYNSQDQTQPVGLLGPNELGLYDMSGQIWEWCNDWYGNRYYHECQMGGVITSPAGPNMGSDKVCRGGAWDDSHLLCRTSYRGRWYPNARLAHLGFRLAVTAH